MELAKYKSLPREEQLSYLAELRQHLKPEHYILRVKKAKANVLTALQYLGKYDIICKITEEKNHLAFAFNSKEERNQVFVGIMQGKEVNL